MTELITGWYCEADAIVEYGPLRLAVAKYFDIDPADVTAAHVQTYESESA